MLQSAVPHLQSAEPTESADTVPDERCLVAQALLADPMRPDDVAWALSMDVVDAIRHIARLESDGVVHRYADGRYGPG
jgi:predicted ArsR family transcriptional regulator